MGLIRRFYRDDVPEVVDLWAKAFRKRESVTAQSLRCYFQEIFLSNPWQSSDLSSLVYEGEDHRIIGFLGVVPRRMRFMGERIQVAVASQLMVDKSKHSAFAPIELLRRFFAGPQDLSFSDGANGLAQKVWQAAGGNVSMLYSPQWTRVLRPAEYLTRMCESRNLLLPFAKVSRPICWAVDAAAARMANSPYRLSVPETVEEDPTEDELLWCIGHFAGDRTVLPDYDPESFKWLLEKASEQKKHGELRKNIIRNTEGQMLGWYLYYVKPGGTSQVLQVGGKCRSIGPVLNHLFYSAWRQGAVAISGQLDPRFALDLTRCHCWSNWQGYGVLLQSRNNEILNAIHRGDAFLTRLDGEWWMRFCDLGDSG